MEKCELFVNANFTLPAVNDVKNKYIRAERLYEMKITICIGSSCHVKGSRIVVERIQELVEENNLADKVSVKGAFCMGKCADGVCVTIDETLHSVSRDEVDGFFEKEVLAKIK